MFLDEELLELCRNAVCDTHEDIQNLNVQLCEKCETYYKSKITPNMRKMEVKAILDRTFNLWDSFTRTAIKEDGKMKILGTLFQSYTFKKQFLSNPDMERVYGTL
jgi:uncharacterized sporulation protein YeaH/YhbH (DUF444 family)